MAKARDKNASGKARALALPLAQPGDPYVLPDGQRIGQFDDGKEADTTLPKKSGKAFRSAKKRTIKELPVPPELFNGIACVLLYTIMGVGDREMAEALKINTAQVKTIRDMPAYNECFDVVFNEFINVNSEMIHARIAAFGNDMITNIAEIATKGKNEGNKLRASQDLADRGGFTKKENTVRLGMSDALRIIVSDADKGKVEVSIGGSIS